ncbi:hypothetical protein R3P38DRAFT_3117001 [Favolaschia claudopus]|uniref:Uncharacterized protein n=1 Tax=Favolaschia claudopus TaxID=2862362 RepID=A0AAV9ZF59_9AGAR
MHIILTDAPILQHCLASPKITRVSVLSRRMFTIPPSDLYGVDTTKARVIVHEDYTSYPITLLEELKGAEGCIWAQGTSQNDVSKKEYIRVTHDSPVNAAKAFSGITGTDHFNFVHISGQGVDSNATLYTRIKGRAEKSLLELSDTPPHTSLRVFNVRPGYLSHCGIAPVLRVVAPGIVTPAAALSKVCVELVTGDGKPLEGEHIVPGGRTVLGEGIKKLAALR